MRGLVALAAGVLFSMLVLAQGPARAPRPLPPPPPQVASEVLEAAGAEGVGISPEVEMASRCDRVAWLPIPLERGPLASCIGLLPVHDVEELVDRLGSGAAGVTLVRATGPLSCTPGIDCPALRDRLVWLVSTSAELPAAGFTLVARRGCGEALSLLLFDARSGAPLGQVVWPNGLGACGRSL